MATKLKTISLRTPNGWRDHVPNESGTHCDLDGAELWQAPHGGIYCNRVHVEALPYYCKRCEKPSGSLDIIDGYCEECAG